MNNYLYRSKELSSPRPDKQTSWNKEEGARSKSTPEGGEGSGKRHPILTREAVTFKAFSHFVGRGRETISHFVARGNLQLRESPASVFSGLYCYIRAGVGRGLAYTKHTSPPSHILTCIQGVNSQWAPEQPVVRRPALYSNRGQSAQAGCIQNREHQPSQNISPESNTQAPTRGAMETILGLALPKPPIQISTGSQLPEDRRPKVLLATCTCMHALMLAHTCGSGFRSAV